MRKSILVSLLVSFAAGLAAKDAHNYYLNPKAYADYPARTSEFNASGQGITFATVSPGTVRIVFDDLAEFTYRPALQVSHGGTGAQNCSGNLEIAEPNLVAVVTCRSGSQFVDPQFSILIVDESSDAGYLTLTTCLGSESWSAECGAANAHNPWTRREVQGIRIATANGRVNIFFRLDNPAEFSGSPTALVTPRSPLNNCEVYSVGSKLQQANEFGVEIACTSTVPQSVTSTGPRPVVDPTFHVMVIPNAARTAHVLVTPSGGTLIGYNRWGSVTSEKQAVGTYRVFFRSAAYEWHDRGIAMVRSHGKAGGKSCAVTAGNRVAAHDLQVDVVCSKLSGEPVDSGFVLAATARH